MSKGNLHKASGLSSSTMTKLRKGEDVSMEALRKICVTLNCNIADIVEFVWDILSIGRKMSWGRIGKLDWGQGNGSNAFISQ